MDIITVLVYVQILYTLKFSDINQVPRRQNSILFWVSSSSTTFTLISYETVKCLKNSKWRHTQSVIASTVYFILVRKERTELRMLIREVFNSCKIVFAKNRCILGYKTVDCHCYRRLEDIFSLNVCPVQGSFKFIRTVVPNLSHYHYKLQNPRWFVRDGGRVWSGVGGPPACYW